MGVDQHADLHTALACQSTRRDVRDVIHLSCDPKDFRTLGFTDPNDIFPDIAQYTGDGSF